ncbi:MAG TPA: hypothetical protein VH138_05485 [Vicinamibacterales bacterium]|nr:hypothetical protein [Vicinamibacterales bacterium]
MKRCPLCLSQVPDTAATCACGAPLGESAPAPDQPAPSRPTTRLRDALLIVVATVCAAVLTFIFLTARGGPSPTLAAAAARVTALSSAPSAVPPPAAVLPATANETWSNENRSFWLGYRRGAAFQLLAENTVHTFFGPTQPLLVVRCVSRTAEAFVYMKSPSRIEPGSESKTVTVGIDDEPARTEQWSDSDDRVALFAPDGDAFARRLLRAQTLRFGYTPANASDVVAQFHVAGLARLLEPAARDCGWKK